MGITSAIPTNKEHLRTSIMIYEEEYMKEKLPHMSIMEIASSTIYIVERINKIRNA